MKKCFILCLFYCCAILGYGQENEANRYDDQGKSLLQVDTLSGSSLEQNRFSSRMEEQVNLFLFPNSYTTTDFIYRNPWGYTNEYVGFIDSNFYYSIIGSSDMWPGITAINTASFNLHYAPDLFALNIGTDLWKYSNLNRPYNDVAFHADASYQLLPWFTVGAYGQLSLYSKDNVEDGSALSSPMVPFTGYGVYGRVMFNSVFGIQGGVGRQFNPIRGTWDEEFVPKGKWEPTYGVGAVIELKRKKRR